MSGTKWKMFTGDPDSETPRGVGVRSESDGNRERRK